MLLNKIDLVSDVDLERIESRLQRINNVAPTNIPTQVDKQFD